MRQRVLPALFIALSLLQLLPIWGVKYFPTADGPSHLYNSWVLRELVTGNANDAVRSHYEVDWRPHPNWTGHVLMAVAMAIVPTLAAEKLFASLIVLALLGGAWYLATASGRDRAPYAFLAFPFVFHSFFFYGFYNFSLSVGIYLLTIATWWRRRADSGLRSIALTAALLLTCYFTHPMATAFAIGSIGLLWLYTFRRSLLENGRHLLALVPASLLLIWFLRSQGAGAAPSESSYTGLARSLLTMASLFLENPPPGGMVTAMALTGVFITMAVVTLIRERWFQREEDAFLILFFALTLIYFLAPARLVGGGEVNERLAVFLPLVLLPWFSVRAPRPAISCLVIAFSIAAVVYPLATLQRVGPRSRQIARYLEAAVHIPRGSVVMPLIFDGTYWLSHASCYAATERQSVQLSNFEPSTGYFPIAYRKGTVSSRHDIEPRPETIWEQSDERGARHVFTWKLPYQLENRGRRLRYQLLHSRGHWKLYERIPEGETTTVLLPFVGTASDFISATGTIWRIDQQVTNISTRPVRFAFVDCATVAPCETDLSRGEKVEIRSAAQRPHYGSVVMKRESTRFLDFSTTLRRVDPQGDGFAQTIPAVTPDQFQERLVFENVSVTRNRRVNLRIWATPPVRRARYQVRILSNGRELASRFFATEPDGFQNDPDILEWLPDRQNHTRADIIVEVDQPASIWALLVSTDIHTTRPEVLFPGMSGNPSTLRSRARP